MIGAQQPPRRRLHDRALGVHLRRSALIAGARRIAGAWRRTCAPRTSTTRCSRPTRCATMNGVPVAIIGQAFPYTPIANPRHFVPDWTFGIQERSLQQPHRRGCARKGAQGGGAAVAQRHGRRPQARRPRARPRRDPRRPHARRAAAAGARSARRWSPTPAPTASSSPCSTCDVQARRRDATTATACCRCSRDLLEADRGHGGATSPACASPIEDRLDEKLATTRRTALPPRQLQRHVRPADPAGAAGSRRAPRSRSRPASAGARRCCRATRSRSST